MPTKYRNGGRAAFKEAVEDYLASCANLGRAAQKSASGRLMLHLLPEVHTAALLAEQVNGQSLNQWATQALLHAAEQVKILFKMLDCQT